MATEFDKAGYKNKVAQKMTYDERTHFTDINVVHYMAEMEEYFMHLIRETATLNGDEHAAISTLPMELLP